MLKVHFMQILFKKVSYAHCVCTKTTCKEIYNTSDMMYSEPCSKRRGGVTRVLADEAVTGRRSEKRSAGCLRDGPV